MTDPEDTRPVDAIRDDSGQAGLDRSAEPIGGSDRRVRRKTLSEILTEISEDSARDVVAVSDLIATLGGRGRAALILIFAFPNILPSPPGLAGVLGVPLIYLSLQMIAGRIPWLPRMIADRSVPRDRFAQFITRLAPILARAERLLRPRWAFFVNHRAEQVLGILFLVLAVVLSLPIPFGNMLPSFAMCVIALGILERDGVWVIVGVLIGFGAILMAGGVIYAVVKSSLFLLMNAFS
ncbi:MAG: hypothetical protein B7X55_02450 [Rhodobacterales bacterium 34-62-10]|nr:MAG: hypothetical protein B7X55_02450 [Rhodobacterales bacterium 34-62-10]